MNMTIKLLLIFGLLCGGAEAAKLFIKNHMSNGFSLIINDTAIYSFARSAVAGVETYTTTFNQTITELKVRVGKEEVADKLAQNYAGQDLEINVGYDNNNKLFIHTAIAPAPPPPIAPPPPMRRP